MPLPILPDIFYYSQGISSLQASHTPQGEIHFDHLLQNRPDYWITASPSRVKKKKKLIIANLVPSPSGLLIQFSKRIPELIDEGFELYFWENGTIHRIIPPFNVPKKAESAFPDEIMDAAFLSDGFTRDELHIIDDFWIRYLVKGKMEGKYKISNSNIENIIAFNEENKNSFKTDKNPILMAGREVTHIENSNFSKSINYQFKLIKKAFPNATVDEDYVAVKLDALETLYFIKAMEKKLNYSQEGTVFTPNHLEHIGYLALDGSALEDSKALFKVLRKATHLNIFSLSHGTIEELYDLPQQITDLMFKNTVINNVTLLPRELKTISSFELTQCSVSADNLKKILAATSDLRYLTLSHCTIEGIWDTADFSTLEYLKINVKHTNILHQLGKIAPKLTDLILEGPYDPALKPFIDALKPRVRVDWPAERGEEEPVVVSSSPQKDIPLSLRRNNQPSKNKNRSLDANTSSDPNRVLPVQRIFYSVDGEEHPAPNQYRLEAYNDIEINDEPCSIDNAFTLKQIGGLELSPCDAHRSTVDVYAEAKKYRDEARKAYYGKQQLVLTTEWQAVASLSGEEQLLEYHLDSDVAVELRYSQRDNLYYVRSKEEGFTEATMDFMVTVPKVKRTLPASFEHLANRYEAFIDGSLAITSPNPTGHDYLQAIEEQGKGVCRHKAFAFKAAMREKNPNIPVRIINNDCHSFVELYSDGHWISRDLGGAAARLEIIEAEEAPKPGTAPLPDSSPEGRFLETWNKEAVVEESVAAFCQKIVQPADGAKRLIELSSTSDVNALRILLQQHGQHSGHRVFCINSPDELVCAAPWIARQQEGEEIKGVVTAGPGGRLYEFLTNNPHNEPRTLLINYANFTAEDVVRLNTILDKKPQVDGIDIPSSVTIVGMTNIHGANYYSGEDFYSRFDSTVQGPKSSALTAAKKPHAIAPRQPNAEDTKVEHLYLFHSANWKNELLGHWIMDGKNIKFKEGTLQKALNKGLPIVIHQGLWEDEEFLAFWEQAKLYGRIEHSGGTLQIPAGFELLREDKYDWASLSQNIKGSEILDAQAQLLNPGTLAKFFSHYACDNSTKTLSRKQGFIETGNQTADKTLPVYLTRALTEDQWGMLGHACNEHGVTLKVHPAPGVVLPEVLNIKLTRANPPAPALNKKGVGEGHTLVISSTDIDATVALLTIEDPDWLVFDITGLRGSDLLTQINAAFDAEALSFQFSQTQRALLTAFEQGKKVVLKGTFSPELLDALAPLIHQRTQEGESKVPLVLIGDDLSQGHYLRERKTHQVSVEDKLQCLRQEFSEEELINLPKGLIKTDSLAQHKARLIYQRINPGKNTDDAWAGLTTLPKTLALAPLREDEDTKALTNAFNQQRKKQVTDTLKHAPYVYLTGLTGVGKTTFVEKYIKTEDDVAFYSGYASLKDWALDKTPGKVKIFFEDEINLNPHQWNELEGLFHKPPGILINGVHYPLTPEHQFIIAGNPLAYGDERHLSPVFQKHGNALLFEPLPLACIYEDILKPVFAGTDLAKDSWAICQPFLEVYSFLLTHSQNELLISPRELQMMAALTLSHHQKTPNDDRVHAACYYARQVTQHLVPQTKTDDYALLPSVVQANAFIRPALPRSEDALGFLLTPSREPIAQQLLDLLSLSELRKNNAAHYNKAQLYGGLGGIILNGDVGIGKSEIVIAVLRQQGYQERHFKPRLATTVAEEPTAAPQKIFYRMPAGLPLSVKQQLILKAFDEGAVLIADEVNSSPMLERWFNDLLMGKHPLTKQPPKIPGFCLVGTKNPPTLAGRRRASPATDRRLMQVNVPPYTHEEMVQILIQKEVEDSKAEHLVTLFEAKRLYAQENHLKPPPTFRDLLKLAELGLKHDGYKQALKTLKDTIVTLPAGSVKDSALAIKEQIISLHAKGEKSLTSYLTITQQLLHASPETRPMLFEQFQEKTAEAQGHPSPLWQNLAKAMLVLGIALAIAAVLVIAFTGFGIIPAIGIAASAASLGTSIGFFAQNRPQGLAKAMSDLDANLQQEAPEQIEPKSLE